MSEKAINTLLEILVDYSIESDKPYPPINDLVGRRPKGKLKRVKVSEITSEQIEKAIRKKELKKLKYEESVQEYLKEIEEMNRDIPDGLQIDKYQSHDVKVLESTSSCSRFRYLKWMN